MMIANKTFHWKGFGGCNSKCHLSIYFNNNESLVIATELESNLGTSIANDAKKLIKLVCQQFELNPQATMWIEHYKADEDTEERYSIVNCNCGQITWEYISIPHVVELIGKYITDE